MGDERFMSYTTFTVLALIIHFIISFDIFRSKVVNDRLPAVKPYKFFLISIAVFYVTDILWGVFDQYHLATALYIDTVFYFVMMGATILFWTRYIVRLLEKRKSLVRIFEYVGFAFFAAEMVLLILNIPFQILFRVDPETALYESYSARNIMLWFQIGMYLLIAVYTLVYSFKSDAEFKRRNLAISVFSITSAIFIFVQIFDPFQPYYSMGMLVGVCILSSFVVNDIREEYRAALVVSRQKEKAKEEALDDAIHMVHTDPLTGVQSKHAYVEMEERVDKLIANNKAEDFAIVVFDLNGLKAVNDTKGHEAGDKYIVDSVKIIEKYFGEKDLYRFGGDEFVIILRGDSYKDRKNLLTVFNKYMDDCLDTDLPVISAGMSAYKREEDNTYRAVFNRADRLMYARKEMLKERQEN